MKPTDMSSLVKAWIEYHAMPEKQGDFWAWEAVSEAISERPEEGWNLVLELIREAPDKHILANVAAGPLEDLIVQHSEAFIERIEEMARKDPQFRLALSGVWCEGDIPKELFDRIHFYVSSVLEPL